MSFYAPKAIQNVGIFYCYTGHNMIPKKKIFSIVMYKIVLNLIPFFLDESF